jgi:O-antigen/teichoic acid export membrane protein
MNRDRDIRWLTAGHRLARNAGLNVIGQAVPALVGLACVPFAVRGLGPARFGILALAWVVFGWFSVFDLGLGRATTKFVAAELASPSEDGLAGLVWTSIALQASFGLLGACLLWMMTPLLVGAWLSVPPALAGDARTVFRLIAVALPFAIAARCLRGVLEAGQRFDLVNLVKGASQVLLVGLPVLSVAGLGLPGIAFGLACVQIGTGVVLLVTCLHVYPALCRRPTLRASRVPALAAFGGWVTISGVLAPVLVSVDRFLIASLAGVAAVSYYSVPYDAVTGLWIVPSSLAAVLFPAFCGLDTAGDAGKIELLFLRSVKYLLIVLAPALAAILALAHGSLLLWLGPEFALRSTAPLQVLAVGVTVNSIANVPYSGIQGLGRPDLTAKLHLIELPLHVAVVWLMVGQFGIFGAACAWAARVTVDALVLFALYHHLRPIPLKGAARAGVAAAAGAGLVLVLGAAVLTLAVPSFEVRLIVMGVVIVAFAAWVWRRALGPEEKHILRIGTREPAAI